MHHITAVRSMSRGGSRSASAIERPARAAVVAVVADTLGDLLERAGNVALEIAQMGIDRFRQLRVPDGASRLVLGRFRDQGGEMKPDPIDQRPAADGAVRELVE